MAGAAMLTMLALGSAQAQEAQTETEAQPLFDSCGDGSLAKAQKEGITLGISPSPPYTSIDPNTNKATGLDVEINEAALKWIGVTNIKYEVAPFGQLIPMMLSKRTDTVSSNIHVTVDRLKVVSFSTPAWWYGPAIVTQTGNPKSIKSFDDLKNIEVGVVTGSAADEYLRAVGVKTLTFDTDAAEFAGISQGRVAAILEDDVKVLDFMKANPSAGIEIVKNVAVPHDLIFKYGYGYARYAFRKEDCSLRTAFSISLSELWGSGFVSQVLKKYGLSNRNLTYFPLND
jgi:ABC-type amino acid transport substrate-binding protein